MTPDIQVAHGRPTPEELAVLVAVLNRAGGLRFIAEPTKLTKWGDPHAHMRQRVATNRNAWRQSAWAKH